jgi:hypothetical protein
MVSVADLEKKKISDLMDLTLLPEALQGNCTFTQIKARASSHEVVGEEIRHKD